MFLFCSTAGFVYTVCWTKPPLSLSRNVEKSGPRSGWLQKYNKFFHVHRYVSGKIFMRSHQKFLQWTPAGFLPKDGNERSERRKTPAGSSDRTSVALLSRNWQHFLKIMHKYFTYTECLRLQTTYAAQKHFITFPGGKCPPCPSLRAPVIFKRSR